MKKNQNKMHLFYTLLVLGVGSVAAQNSGGSRVPCYDRQGNAQRCQPPFQNAAFGKNIEATNTCGITKPTEYCMQTGTGADVSAVKKYCYVCDNSHPQRKHPTSYLSDFNSLETVTWWQSETMLEGMQYPTVVNLTLNLKKAFDITYVNLKFHSPRPESFAIYKRTTEDGPWIPYQFYSATCEDTFQLPRRGIITKATEDQAVCSNEFSDISPLYGGTVAFSTLEGRPSMFEFSNSTKLQEWVTATDIRIVLTRMNTFGDEVFGDAQVLKSYFYAISDFAVGARCKCNGHASECALVKGQDLQDRLMCVCEHNTTGADCEKCLPFYNDRPWGRATEFNVNECKACDCNGLSDTCEFDPDLFRTTGHGGRCTNCRDYTDGVHCELCKENYYRHEGECLACSCHPIGSRSLQCDNSGQCLCKPGVGGQRCDRCLPNFYDYSDNGCQPCDCLVAGSLDNIPRCNPTTGLCSCKENVDGRQCDKCKPGYFGLSEKDRFGCISCFCYGHSSECTSAEGYVASNITSNYDRGAERWTAITRSYKEVELQYNNIAQNVGVSSNTSEAVYFSAPARYLGDQRYSYNQYLSFDFRIGDARPKPSVVDIILEGSGQSASTHISTHIYAQSNPVPDVVAKTYAFRIHENSVYQWNPRQNALDLINLLSNLTAIKIRATYSDKGVGFIDNIRLGTARPGYQPEDAATWVESCSCPRGYVGQHCESCIQGFKRSPPFGGPFSKCVACECNQHSDSCDINSGRCICGDNTEGDFCENCVRGYYGDATKGTPEDCIACPCPNGGPCIQLPEGDIVCTECEEGYGGNLCDICLDGYYGDPMGRATGRVSECKKCTCNGNIDPNAVGNCNSTTGECLKCIRNTGGFYCDQCLPNFFNNTNGQCTPCNCYVSGTVSQPGTSGCDQKSGQCLCLPNVIGRRCEECEIGYWDITSGNGCSPCQCDVIGSLNFTCDLTTGQCQCNKGITGQKCDVCQENYFGFSSLGCTACNCDPVGSTSQQCDAYGFCPCKDNVDGRHCDRCMENKYDISAGCLDCPQCYNLVQDEVNRHRGKLRDLAILINKTTNNPSLFNDSQFVAYLTSVNSSINVLLRDARSTSTGDGSVNKQLENLGKSLRDALDKCAIIAANIANMNKAVETSQDDIKAAERALNNAENALKMSEDYIDLEGRAALKQALEALNKFGQNNQQMTEIALNATNEAKRQTEEAKRIEDLAKIALDTSREAYRLANETLSMPLKTSQEIDNLKREYDDASLLYQNTKATANRTYNAALLAKDEALNLFQLANDQLPSLDVDMLKKEAQRIKDESLDIKEKAKGLVKQNEELLSSIQKQREEGEQLLKDGETYRMEIDSYLAEVHTARHEAREAVASAEKTLKEANATLETLQKFDSLIANKEAAEQAMANVSDILKLIEEAKAITKEARDALQKVHADAIRALEIAKDAERKAGEASTEAGRIRDEAGDTRSKSSNLRNEAEMLSDKVTNAKKDVENYEGQIGEDERLANKALLDAAKVKQRAEDAYRQVDEAHRLIMSINTELDVDSVDMSRLKALEAQLNLIEGLLDEPGIEAKMQELQTKNSQIEDQVAKFEFDMTELRAAVANIAEIAGSLPNGCYKSIPIELNSNVG
ncbi:laminin subunit gamma-1-like [Physella acuta]|uniref:laminin subunit gamma-1-like n=1 Tax=Physella acuta TaxID=109671 RepID=UPI0027DEA7E6|nr:laminin subunit gamma-1-like [Physella acuta]